MKANGMKNQEKKERYYLINVQVDVEGEETDFEFVHSSELVKILPPTLVVKRILPMSGREEKEVAYRSFTKLDKDQNIIEAEDLWPLYDEVLVVAKAQGFYA